MPEIHDQRRWLHVIGMGDRGTETLSPPARRALDEAEILFSSSRLFSHIPEDDRTRHIWRSPLKDSLPALKVAQASGTSTCVIATGDPLCYGIGNWLLHHFSREEMEFHPGVSAFALACARMGWAEHEVSLVTLHGRPVTNIRGHISPGQKLVVLSADATTPAKVARQLSELGYGASRLDVYGHLDGIDETHHQAAANADPIFNHDFEKNPQNDLNVIAVTCIAGADARLNSNAAGLPESYFAAFGKITKRELRALAIAHLAPNPGEVFWDVGAGSGSVSIEFLRLAPRSRAVLFDLNENTTVLQHENFENFGLTDRMQSHVGSFVDVVANEEIRLARPNAVFFGGGLGLPEFEAAFEQLLNGGRLVAHAVTMESEAVLAEAFKRFGGQMSRIAISHLDKLGGADEHASRPAMHGYRPAMTVTQWVVHKPRDNEALS